MSQNKGKPIARQGIHRNVDTPAKKTAVTLFIIGAALIILNIALPLGGFGILFSLGAAVAIILGIIAFFKPEWLSGTNIIR